MIVSRDWTSEYKVTEPQVKYTNVSTEISWKFQMGTHFLIFAFERDNAFSYEDIVKEIKNAKLSLEKLTTHGMEPIYISEKLGVRVYCCDEGAFIKNKSKFIINGRKSGITQAHGFAIFACEVDGKDLIIFKKPKNAKYENIGYVPVKVRSEVKYKTSFLKKRRICIIKIERIEHYDDGAVCYKVEGVRGEFPLPSGCIGKELFIEVDKDQEVQIYISPNYNKYYMKY